MKKYLFVILVLSAVALIVFAQHGKEPDALYQVSVLNGLMRGDYDGKISLREVLRHGDFGIGTFDRLDGEEIELDGRFYKAASDGTVSLIKLTATSPFTMAKFFKADMSFPLGREADYRALQGAIDSRLPTKNIPYAVRIDGKFSHVKVRSVPTQGKPYRPLAEVTKGQSVFEFRDIEGTLIGFRIPDYMTGVNLPGYHIHFLSRDKTKGGHILECSLISGEVRIDDAGSFVMALPRSQGFDSLDLSTDTKEVLKVEGDTPSNNKEQRI